MRTLTAAKTFVLVLALAGVASAQDRSVIRELGATTARTTEPVSLAGIRTTPAGVLVNEPSKRRVVLFNNELSGFTIVADSTAETGNAYGGRFGGLIAYKGDSSLFVDPASLSMLVVDPTGKIARVMSVPRAQDAMMLAGGMGGATYDGRGGIVYRGMFRPQFRGGGGGGGGGPQTGGIFTPPDIPDSAPLLRIDLATRRIDTLGFIKTPKVKMDVSRTDDGRISMRSQINPLPVIDEWAALPDGSIAFVRGRDYHVDWIGPDGAKTSSAKVSFDWQRLTDDDKVAFLDSLRAARERMGEGAPGITMLGSALGASDAMMGAGAPNIQIMTGPGGGGGGGGGGGRGDGERRRGAGPPGAASQGRLNAQVNFVDPSELPDYKPAFFAGAVRADAQGNLWIRTIPTKAIPGGPVYDVIDRNGALVERVQIPAGRTIVGFGPNGAVYLIAREGTDSFLEKASVR